MSPPRQATLFQYVTLPSFCPHHLLMLILHFLSLLLVLAEDAIKAAIKDYQKKRAARLAAAGVSGTTPGQAEIRA